MNDVHNPTATPDERTMGMVSHLLTFAGIAAIKANEGVAFLYPLSIRVVS